jgi:hypothetical protein
LLELYLSIDKSFLDDNAFNRIASLFFHLHSELHADEKKCLYLLSNILVRVC